MPYTHRVHPLHLCLLWPQPGNTGLIGLPEAMRDCLSLMTSGPLLDLVQHMGHSLL